MKRQDFWYVVAESKELKGSSVLSRQILGENLAVFRDSNGVPVALQDRCLHRGAQISKGTIINGNLRCPYHGWVYNGDGQVIAVPSEGPGKPAGHRCNTKYQTVEQDDFIYVCFNEKTAFRPFSMPCYKAKGYTTIRLQNRFQNSVTNCAENFVDIPHTTFVHPRIFRDATMEKVEARIERREGRVKVTYLNEKKNFGMFTWFLNPKGKEVIHTDEFFMPNVTSVHYRFGGGKHFIITSQSIPVKDNETLVYTDLTYNYGIWTKVSRPIVRRQAQAIIDQDIEILRNQMENIDRYGARFQNSPADLIHTWIESIQSELESGRDPRLLSEKETTVDIWI